jgi:hypothetical protein
MVSYVGGCLCGSLRYEVNDEPIDAGYCHCRLCQRSAGAPVLVWATFSVATFSYTQGAPSIYQSSVHSQREFCGSCGTQIALRKVEQATMVDVTVASLDEPAIIKPDYHIWSESQLSWFNPLDNLPRHKDAGPDIW